jgi:hypothetical protein
VEIVTLGLTCSHGAGILPDGLTFAAQELGELEDLPADGFCWRVSASSG